MNRFLLFITLTISLATSAVTMKANDFSELQTKAETKTIVLEHFDAIESTMVSNVEVVNSNKEKAVIISNYLQFVEVSVKNNVLKITYKKGQSMENVDTRIIIYARELKSVSAGKASVVRINNDFDIQKFSTENAGKIFSDSKAKKVSISTQSAGSFQGTVNTENLVLNAKSGSLIDIEGKINSALITSAGASNVMAAKTQISEAIVTAESASSVSLSVSKELTASASSLAKINYKTLSGIKFSATRNSGGTIDTF
jgi:hypothetical protein